MKVSLTVNWKAQERDVEPRTLLVHFLRETLGLTDRAYIIKDGRIIREGAPAEITEDPTVREIYLGQNFRL